MSKTIYLTQNEIKPLKQYKIFQIYLVCVACFFVCFAVYGVTFELNAHYLYEE